MMSDAQHTGISAKPTKAHARWVRIGISTGVLFGLVAGGLAVWYTLKEPLPEDPLPLPQDFGLA